MAEQTRQSGVLERLPSRSHAARVGFPAEKVVPLLIGATVNEVERELVLQTLVHCHGNRTHAAQVLGVSICTLRNKIKEYAAKGIAVPPPGLDKPPGREGERAAGRC